MESPHKVGIPKSKSIKTNVKLPLKVDISPKQNNTYETENLKSN